MHPIIFLSIYRLILNTLLEWALDKSEDGIFQVQSRWGRSDTLWRQNVLVMEMQFPGQRFSRPHSYNLKSLKSPRNQRKEKLDDTVETWVERCHVHPRVRNLVPCDTAVACYREIPPRILLAARPHVGEIYFE